MNSPVIFSGNSYFLKLHVTAFIRWLLSFAILLLSLSFSAKAENDFPVEPTEIFTTEKIFSVGDLHGDFDSFVHILKTAGLISPDLSWSGGKSILVLSGDLVNRGPKTKELLDFVMKLQKQASNAGGRVSALLGNHEILVSRGVEDFAHENDARDFDSFKSQNSRKKFEGFRNAFQGNSIYAKWFRSRNAILKINDIIFVHGGLEDWALKFTPLQINEMLREWLKFDQGVGRKPPEGTRWVSQAHGPLWTRVFKEFEKDKESLSKKKLKEILKTWNAEKVVVGHSVVSDLDISLDHPTYGRRVVLSDTGISSEENRKLSLFEHLPSGATRVSLISSKSSTIRKVMENFGKTNSCFKLFR